MGIIKNLKILTGKNSSSHLVQKTILVVEDEKPLQNILKDRLTQEGYDVLTADNGQEGLDMVVANKPRLVILDLLMPVMDGKTMLHKLRDIPEFHDLPVIVLTSAGEVDNIRDTKTYNNAVATNNILPRLDSRYTVLLNWCWSLVSFILNIFQKY